MNLSGYEFDFVGEIKPVRKNGRIFTYNPRDAYDNVRELKLNKYGDEMFCKFKIPSDMPYEGVYCLVVGDEVMYVGECVNLSQRYNMGYGNISPRNVFVGGQSTNCKVNANILKVAEGGGKVLLYFQRTNDRLNVEAALINEHQPAWNSKQVYYKKNVTRPTQLKEHNINHNIRRDKGMGRMSKYHNLYVYLNKRDEEFVKLTYEKMESIIGGELPASAYTYPAWWANGYKSQYHTRTWMDADYLVDEIKYGEYVIFKKV
ncbi:MAG: GIY-YIG nuclease family protein [Clostridiales bacterium]|nr:GIY-YIG nuclease family protein [Clostridiales bacterium]